jgi:hypothetical protein
LHLDVSKVDQVLHFAPRLLLPCLGVSSLPSAALYPSQTAETWWGWRRGPPRDGGVDMSARSPLLLHEQVALRFTFSVFFRYIRRMPR